MRSRPAAGRDVPFGPIWRTYMPHMPSNYPYHPPPRPLRFGSLRYWQRADRKFAKFTKRTLLTCEPKRHHRCWSVGILGLHTTTTDIVANCLLFHANWHFLHPNSDFIAFSVHYFFRARNLSCTKIVGFTSPAKSLVPSRKFSGPDSDPPRPGKPNVQNLLFDRRTNLPIMDP